MLLPVAQLSGCEEGCREIADAGLRWREHLEQLRSAARILFFLRCSGKLSHDGGGGHGVSGGRQPLNGPRIPKSGGEALPLRVVLLAVERIQPLNGPRIPKSGGEALPLRVVLLAVER